MNKREDAAKALRALLPLSVVSVQRGIGSFLTIDAKTHPASEASVCLWVYLCDWNLSLTNRVLDSDQVEDHIYRTVLQRLGGALLTSISELDQGKLLLEFDNGHRLELISDLQAYESSDDLILSYLNDKCFICYSHDRGFYFED